MPLLLRPAPLSHSVMCAGGSGEAKETLVPQSLFHFPMMPGRRAGVWEVCLPASSSSSSSPNSRNRQGRLQLQRGGKQAGGPSCVWGGVGGRRGLEREARSRRSKRHPHPSQTGDRHSDADTFSHSGPGTHTPPTLRGHPDTLNQFCQSPEHSLDTQRDPGPHPHLTFPHKSCGLQTAARGWRGE